MEKSFLAAKFDKQTNHGCDMQVINFENHKQAQISDEVRSKSYLSIYEEKWDN